MLFCMTSCPLTIRWKSFFHPGTSWDYFVGFLRDSSARGSFFRDAQRTNQADSIEKYFWFARFSASNTVEENLSFEVALKLFKLAPESSRTDTFYSIRYRFLRFPSPWRNLASAWFQYRMSANPWSVHLSFFLNISPLVETRRLDIISRSCSQLLCPVCRLRSREKKSIRSSSQNFLMNFCTRPVTH